MDQLSPVIGGRTPEVRRPHEDRRAAARRRYLRRRLTVLGTALAVAGVLALGVWTLWPSAAAVDPLPATSSTTTTTTTTALVNPVLAADFPDPDVVRIGDGYVAFATNSGPLHLQFSESPDLLAWSPPSEALPTLPEWVDSGRPDLWAPSYVVAGDRHLVFFAARASEGGRMCIGVAAAADLSGPYTSTSPEPVLCQTSRGGAIDPAVFVEGGRATLLWKNDGNCCDQDVYIWSQPIDLATLQLSGDPSQLLTVDQSWEGDVIEAPTMVRVDGQLTLFYSGGHFADHSYGVGYAWCDSVAGPCVKPADYPVLSTVYGVVGPGGQSLLVGPDDGWFIAYHAWTAPLLGYESGGARSLRVDRVQFVDRHPVVIGPTQ